MAMKSRAKKKKDVLSKAQIYRRYPSEWVLIEDPVSDRSLRLVRGKVIFHSKHRDEVDRALAQTRPRRWASLYTGRVSDRTAVVL